MLYLLPSKAECRLKGSGTFRQLSIRQMEAQRELPPLPLTEKLQRTGEPPRFAALLVCSFLVSTAGQVELEQPFSQTGGSMNSSCG